jgi:hypothetical protein
VAELSKFFKIVLVINIIAGLIYGILYLFIPNIYATMIESPSFSLQFWRLWGMSCLLLGVMGIIAFFRNDWTMFKMLFEFVILWLIGMNILNIIYLFDPSHNPTSFTSEITDVIIIFVLIILDIYAYLRENKQ